MSEAVTEYYLVDEKDKPICFSSLPIHWPDNGTLDVPKSQVFLRGKVDDGLRNIFRQVVGWKVDIQGACPEVCVLSMNKRWFKLVKPRKAYEGTIRNILVTLQCLLFLRRNPASSDKSLWENVQSIFRYVLLRA